MGKALNLPRGRKLRTRIALTMRTGDRLDADVMLGLCQKTARATRLRLHLNALKLQAKRYRREHASRSLL